MYALPGELRVNHLDLVSVEDLLGARGLVLDPYDLPLDLGHNAPGVPPAGERQGLLGAYDDAIADCYFPSIGFSLQPPSVVSSRLPGHFP